jgi:microcystin-dependent protein
MFGGSFAPAGWAFCNGVLLPISEYETLFNLIGTTYGGDGQSTFALPDFRGRVPIHMGTGPGLSSRQLGESGGVETVTLTTQQLPVHSHPFVASTDFAGQSSPGGNVVAQLGTGGSFIYIANSPTLSLAGNSVQATGGSQPHDNMQPYTCISFIISLFGVYPSPN